MLASFLFRGSRLAISESRARGLPSRSLAHPPTLVRALLVLLLCRRRLPQRPQVCSVGGSGEGALAPLLSVESSAAKLEVGAAASVGGCSGGEN